MEENIKLINWNNPSTMWRQYIEAIKGILLWRGFLGLI